MLKPDEFFDLLQRFRFASLWFQFTPNDADATYKRMWTVASELAFELVEQDYPARFQSGSLTNLAAFEEARARAIVKANQNRSLVWTLSRIEYQKNAETDLSISRYLKAWSEQRIATVDHTSHDNRGSWDRNLVSSRVRTSRALSAVHVGLAGETTNDADLLQLANSSLIRPI